MTTPATLQPLTMVGVGRTATVAEIKLPPESRPRLMEMGLLVGTRVELVRVGRALLRFGCRWKGERVVAGQAQVAVGIASDQPEIEVARDIEAELRRAREVVVVVVVARLPGSKQIQRCDRRRARVKVLQVHRVVKPAVGPAEARCLVECLERSGLRAGRELRRPGATLRDDVDYAADGIGAVEAALRAAQNFDGLNVLGQEAADVE